MFDKASLSSGLLLAYHNKQYINVDNVVYMIIDLSATKSSAGLLLAQTKDLCLHTVIA